MLLYLPPYVPNNGYVAMIAFLAHVPEYGSS